MHLQRREIAAKKAREEGGAKGSEPPQDLQLLERMLDLDKERRAIQREQNALTQTATAARRAALAGELIDLQEQLFVLDAVVENEGERALTAEVIAAKMALLRAELAQMGVPRLQPMDATDTAAAFREAERLLQSQLGNLQDCPAPLLCHMTDGEYNSGGDPEPIARRIMQMAVQGHRDCSVAI